MRSVFLATAANWLEFAKVRATGDAILADVIGSVPSIRGYHFIEGRQVVACTADREPMTETAAPGHCWRFGG